ncbi:hypothetical protein TNIN_469781 [Trichonephila inaurata madagascariensis]|uniref:Uncharacterized protein n=1 Tax=Trichonephila inaurata madagascariensis TaxID=2747483 RepID=A0A8X6XS27_9ARAC|nr:hypothetical protein TNIN_469781 [Trichonephila inaurata madagascariensis]
MIDPTDTASSPAILKTKNPPIPAARNQKRMELPQSVTTPKRPGLLETRLRHSPGSALPPFPTPPTQAYLPQTSTSQRAFL